jgi:hypothetical protein
MVALPMLAASAMFVRVFWPGAMISAPFWPIVFLLLWRALRRMQERDADAGAIRATGDPEALITGLARLSYALGTPMHWGPLAGTYMPHPPMTTRFRLIAQAAGISAARVEELVSLASKVPALPGYPSPFEQPALDESSVFAAHRNRLEARMSTLSQVFPVAAGIAASTAALLWQPEFAVVPMFAAGWILGSIAAYYVMYELVVGLERRRFRNQLPSNQQPNGHFVGFSTAAEPRVFHGLYHYDLGIARIDGGLLRFDGARCSFSIKNEVVRQVWLANGPRHWTPRRIVCMEYLTGNGMSAVISMQALGRWFWPATSRAANQLLTAVTDWSRSAASGEEPAVLPPRVEGAIVPRFPLADALKAMKPACFVSLFISLLICTLLPLEPSWFFEPFLAPLVTGAVILFALSPHLERGGKPSTNADQTQKRVSANPATGFGTNRPHRVR